MSLKKETFETKVKLNRNYLSCKSVLVFYICVFFISKKYHDSTVWYHLVSTWFEFVFEERHQVVLLQQQLPVQVRDDEVRQRPQTLQNPLLLFFSADLSSQVTYVVLKENIHIMNQWNSFQSLKKYFVSQIKTKMCLLSLWTFELTINSGLVGPSCSEMFLIIFIRRQSFVFRALFMSIFSPFPAQNKTDKLSWVQMELLDSRFQWFYWQNINWCKKWTTFAH